MLAVAFIFLYLFVLHFLYFFVTPERFNLPFISLSLLSFSLLLSLSLLLYLFVPLACTNSLPFLRFLPLPLPPWHFESSRKMHKRCYAKSQNKSHFNLFITLFMSYLTLCSFSAFPFPIVFAEHKHTHTHIRAREI